MINNCPNLHVVKTGYVFSVFALDFKAISMFSLLFIVAQVSSVTNGSGNQTLFVHTLKASAGSVNAFVLLAKQSARESKCRCERGSWP